jgi:hypothetical protein
MLRCSLSPLRLNWLIAVVLSCLTLHTAHGVALLLSLQLNRLIAAKLAAVSSTRLLGSIMGDLQQAARRLRELLGSILAAAAAATAAAAAAAAAAGSAAAAAAAGGAGGAEANGVLQKHASSASVSAAAAAAAKGGSGKGGAAAAAAAAASAADAVRTELQLLRLLLDPLEAQVKERSRALVLICCCPV